jgi:hypothetical protein
MRAHAPIELDALTAAFHDAYHRLGGRPEQPDPRAAWRAFRELALRPVVPGGVAPEIDEDFFMVEVWPGGDYRPELSIRRSVGLADEKHDHLETVHFWLALFHEDHTEIAALRSGSAYESFPAERNPADVAAFLDEIERSDAYKLFVLGDVPVGIEVSEPPVRDLPPGDP